MSHLRAADGTVLCEHEEPHQIGTAPLRLAEPERADDRHAEEHEHSHGLVDRSILRSRAGIRAVSWSLGILTITALAHAFIYTRTLGLVLVKHLAGVGARRSFASSARSSEG